MRIVIEVESVEELRRVCADLAAQGEPAAKGKRTPKPTESVKGNPDEQSAEPPASLPQSEAPAAKTAEPVQAAEPATPEKVTLRADAPTELVKLADDASREAVGKAVLRAAKPKEEGGLTKAALMPFLEKLLSVPKDTPIKLGMIPDDKLAAVRKHLLKEYSA